MLSSAHSEDSYGALRRSVAAALNEFGYRYTVNAEETDFRFVVVIPTGARFRAQILLSPPCTVLRLFVYLTDKYPASLRDWVAELVHRLDEKTSVLGAFGFDYESGAAFFRYGVDFEGRSPSTREVTSALNAASYPLQLWELAASFTASAPKVSPRQAVDAAMLVNGIGEFADEPQEALRLVLKAEAGGGRSSVNDTPPSLQLLKFDS